MLDFGFYLLMASGITDMVVIIMLGMECSGLHEIRIRKVMEYYSGSSFATGTGIWRPLD